MEYDIYYDERLSIYEMVYKLYELTEEEIKIVERKNK